VFIQRAVLRPAIGRTAALRDLLVTAVRSDQTAVAQRIWGEPLFTVLRPFETLAALQTWRDGWQPNPAVAKELGHVPVAELWEVPPLPVGQVVKYTSRFTYHPSGGKARELRDLLEQRAKDANAGGGRNTVWLGVSGGAQSLAIIGSHDSLGALEKVRATVLADPATQKFSERVAALVAKPVESPDVFEILIGSI
jgi:hypothetical protein